MNITRHDTEKASSTAVTYWYASSSTPTHSPPWNPATDHTIATLLLIIIVVGLPGNVAAFLYFRIPRNSTLPDKLYTAIIFIDILTLLSALPVIVSLFNNRAPALFSHPDFCSIWTISNNALFRISILLVTILSFTRTIAIMMPHRAKNFRVSMITLSVVTYIAIILTIDWVALAQGWLRGEHYTQFSYCTLILDKTTPYWALRLYEILVQIEMILPSVVVFFSFLLSSSSLLWKTRVESENETSASLRQASVTITLFTALFLLCNIPIFTYQTSWLVQTISAPPHTPKLPILHGHYGGLMFQYFPYVLNAGLNPGLYVLRMPRYRAKIVGLLSGFSQHFRYSITSDLSVWRPFIFVKNFPCSGL